MPATLDQPLALPCGQVLPNRMMKSAMSETLGTAEQRVTPALATLYGRWAQGGLGLCVTGNVMVDRRALGEPGNVVLEDDRDAELLRAWATAGRAHGTRLWMQLNHPGRQAPRGLNRVAVAPSVVPFTPELAPYFAPAQALDEAGIEDILARFARAAGLAKAAGFDGVQVHGAHGYLVSQFLSPHLNRREDGWGGDPPRRRRFLLALVDRIRAEVGPRFPVGVKLNSADFQKGGFTEEEALEAVEALAARGVDLVEISGGTYEAPAMATGGPARESTQRREAYFLAFAEQARGRVRVPLAVTGGFRTRAGMDAALASGALDLVGLARALAMDPDFPRKLLEDPAAASPVRPLRTGIAAIDRAALLEVAWYQRQLHRMGRGRPPVPDEAALTALIASAWRNGLGTVFTRLRA